MEAKKDDLATKARCARLRWKGLYVETVPDATVPPGNDRLFWCNWTQICLGPDCRPVDSSDCNRQRSCYEEL